MENIKFIDLFCGIGGFHLALHQLGAKCIMACEIDDHARKTYQENFIKINPDIFNSNFYRNIKDIDPSKIDDFDILCAGFPCQPFSQVGQKKGFTDTRGTLFYEILKITKVKRPRAIFLENVRYLINHDNGNTLKIIKNHIESLGYSFNYKIVRASDFNLPQHRPRLFIVCLRDGKDFIFPKPRKLTKTMSDVFKGDCTRDIGFTLRVGGGSSGINDRRNWDTYLVDGKEKKITPVEAKKMQGFPSYFKFPVSKTQALKQLGNSVAVPAIKAVAKNIIDCLNKGS